MSVFSFFLVHPVNKECEFQFFFVVQAQICTHVQLMHFRKKSSERQEKKRKTMLQALTDLLHVRMR